MGYIGVRILIAQIYTKYSKKLFPNPDEKPMIFSFLGMFWILDPYKVDVHIHANHMSIVEGAVSWVHFFVATVITRVFKTRTHSKLKTPHSVHLNCAHHQEPTSPLRRTKQIWGTCILSAIPEDTGLHIIFRDLFDWFPNSST